MERKRLVAGQESNALAELVEELKRVMGTYTAIARTAELSEKSLQRYRAGKLPKTGRELGRLVDAAGAASVGVPLVVLNLLKRLPGSGRATEEGSGHAALDRDVLVVQVRLRDHDTQLADLRQRIDELERMLRGWGRSRRAGGGGRG